MGLTCLHKQEVTGRRCPNGLKPFRSDVFLRVDRAPVSPGSSALGGHCQGVETSSVRRALCLPSVRERGPPQPKHLPRLRALDRGTGLMVGPRWSVSSEPDLFKLRSYPSLSLTVLEYMSPRSLRTDCSFIFDEGHGFSPWGLLWTDLFSVPPPPPHSYVGDLIHYVTVFGDR